MKPAAIVSACRRRERGLVLLCALLLLLAAMLAGLGVARTTFASAAGARYERDRQVARGAAEAALLDAERDIESGTLPARAALFTPAGAASWPIGCGQGAHDRGLCRARDPPAWQTLDLAAPGNPALVPYGGFTGASMAAGGGLLPARPPAYLVESMGTAPGLFRITAIGFGTRATTVAVLQALYRRRDAAGPAGAPPAGRMGSREVANWPELHARALR